MFSKILFAVWHIIVHILLANGFPGPFFKATTSQMRSYLNQQRRIKNWEIQDIQGFQNKDGEAFQANVFGVYVIGYTVNIQGPMSKERLQACISINYVPNCQTLTSEYNQTEKKNTGINLHANGVIKLLKGDVISLQVISNYSWYLAPNSVFFSKFLHEYGIAPSFYVHPVEEEQLKTTKNQLIRRWGTLKIGGGFINTRSFSQNFGVFSVTISGVYLVALNIIVEKCSIEDRFFLVLQNSNNEIMRESLTTKDTTSGFTMHINAIVKLESGTRTFMYLKRAVGKSPCTILTTSSYSVAMLRSMVEGLYGFSLKSSHREEHKNGSQIDLTRLEKSVGGGFNTVLSDGKFNYKAGSYLICFNLNLFCTALCKVSVHINLERVVSSLQEDSQKVYVSRCASIFLRETDSLSIKVFTDTVDWFLETGSSISMIRLQELFPALNIGPPTTHLKSSNNWIRVQKLSIQQSDAFMLADTVENGKFVVRRSGVYLIHSNVIFSTANQAALSACIALNDDPSVVDGLLATKTAVSGSQTLLISSAIYLEKGQHISLFVKCIGYGRWELDEDTTMSVMFLGEKDLITGFQTTLITDVTHKSIGWRTPAYWNKPRDVTSKPWSFATGAKLSPLGGFKVNVPGLYHVAANIMLGNADLVSDLSVFIGMIALNDETGSELVLVKQSGKIQSNQNDITNEITLSLSTVLYLKRGDTVAIKVMSRLDSIWVIRKETGFSVVRISHPIPNSEMSGLLAQNCNNSSLGIKEKYGNWTTSGKDSKLFTVGDKISVHEEVIWVKSPGIYTVSINAQLSGARNTDIFLGILNLSSRRKTICAKHTHLSRESSISCNMLLYLTSRHTIKVFFYRKGDGLISIGPVSLSIAKMARPRQFPWFYAELKENMKPKDTVNLKDWFLHSSGGGKLLGHNGMNFLHQNERKTELFRGLALLSVNLIFDHIINGKQIVSLRETGSNRTISSISHYFDDTKRFTKGIIPSSHVISLSSNGIELIIDANGSIINRKSSFSLSYVHFASNEEFLNIHLRADKILAGKGILTASDWTSSDAEKKFNGIMAKKGYVYFVSMRVIAIFATDELDLQVCDEANSTLMSWIISRHSSSQSTSYALSGIFKSAITGQLHLEIRSRNASQFKIVKGSLLNLIPIREAPKAIGLVTSLQLSAQEKSWFGVQPVSISFINGFKLMDDTLIVYRNGIYLVTLDISITTQARTLFEVLLMVNGERENCIYAKREIRSKGMISFVNSLFLQSGMFLNIRIKASQETGFDILPTSKLGILLMNDLDYRLNGKLLPVSYKDILPSGKHYGPIGQPFSMKCHVAADDRIIYNWFRNGNLIASGESETIKLQGYPNDAGEYYCEAAASNSIAISKKVTVELYDINECLDGSHTCTGKNQTCLNTFGSYKCICAAGLYMDRGDCKVEKLQSDVGAVKNAVMGLPVAIILLAPIAILVCVFVVGVAIFTWYRNKKAAVRQLLHHNGSFSEQSELRLQGEGHDHFDSQDDSYNEADSGQSISMRDLAPIKEAQEVKFSFGSDSSDSTMDLREDEHVLNSAV